MKLSFRSKLLALVCFAISLAALPIIFFSRDYLIRNSLERERDSFVNTVSLLEDSIEVRYLEMLTAEVEAVFVAKDGLAQTASLLRNASTMEGGKGMSRQFAQWQDFLKSRDYHLAMYDESGLALVKDSLISAATAPNVTDFKGQSMRTRLVTARKQKESSFSVVEVSTEAGLLPVLLCFMPVPGEGVLVLAVQVDNIRQSRLQTEKSLVLSVQERLNELELSEGAAITVISRSGQLIGSKGRTFTLGDIPEKARLKVMEGGALNGESVGPNGTEFLYHLTYFKAMDWYIAAVITKEAISEPAELLSKKLVAVAAFLLALSLLAMLPITMRIIRPLRQLTDKARELASEDFGAEGVTHLEEKIRRGMQTDRADEVGQLASSFAALGKALDENISRLKETVAVRQRMEGELNAARDIQMGILPPPESAPKNEQYSASAFLLPAKEVGGDLYDFFTAPDGRQVFVIGDVSDKGVSAALFMSMTVTLVRYAIAEGLSCAEAMSRINDRLAENNPSCMFVTLFIGMFDPMTGELDYASGAHCPPFVVSEDPSVPVRSLDETSGPLVGAMEGMEYTPCRAVIGRGEYCFIYTDGVSEAMNEAKELFSEQKIAKELDTMRNAEPEQVISGIMEAVVRHRGEAAQSDDITMLCFRRS